MSSARSALAQCPLSCSTVPSQLQHSAPSSVAQCPLCCSTVTTLLQNSAQSAATCPVSCGTVSSQLWHSAQSVVAQCPVSCGVPSALDEQHCLRFQSIYPGDRQDQAVAYAFSQGAVHGLKVKVKVNAFILVTYNYKEHRTNDLAAIHVIKRSIDFQLWIMVSGYWY